MDGMGCRRVVEDGVVVVRHALSPGTSGCWECGVAV